MGMVTSLQVVDIFLVKWSFNLIFKLDFSALCYSHSLFQKQSLPLPPKKPFKIPEKSVIAFKII